MIVEVALGDGVERIEVPETEIIRFSTGVVGFEKLRRFALFELDSPYCLLQSVEDPHVGFVAVDPFLVDPSYRVESAATVESLAFADGDSRTMLCIVTVASDGAPDTVNMRAPIIINATRRLGTQVISQEEWPVRRPLRLSETSGDAADAVPATAAFGGQPC